MAEKIPYDTQKTLYSVAMEVLALEPWTFLDEPDTFALKPSPEDETYYVCVTGSAGISRSLIFYRGARGWDAYQTMLSREAGPSSLVHSLDCLNLDFEPWKALNPDARKRLQRFGYGPGDIFLPDPVVYKPSRPPRPPDRGEVELFIRLVEAALPILRRCRDTPDYLDEKEDLILQRLPGPDGKSLEDAWLPPPEAPDPRDDAAPRDEIMLSRVKKGQPRPDNPWEVQIGDLGIAVGKSGETEAMFPMVALFAEVTSGFLTGYALAPVDEMPSRLPHECLKAMQNHGVRPAAFHVERDDVAAWLGPTAEELGIPIVRKAALPKAEEAMEAFRKHMAEEGPGKKASGKGKAPGRGGNAGPGKGAHS